MSECKHGTPLYAYCGECHPASVFPPEPAPSEDKPVSPEVAARRAALEKHLSDEIARMRGDDAEITRLRAALAQLEQESDAEIALLRDYLASAERHRAEEMEERHRLAREVIRLRADLAAAQEREQRMREALQKIASYSEAMSADYIGYGGESGHAHTARLARAALGEPQ